MGEQARSDQHRDRLIGSLMRALNGTLGAVPLGDTFTNKAGPFATGIRFGIVYFVIFCLFPLAISYWRNTNVDMSLFYLSCWGSAYIFFASWTANGTDKKVLSLIYGDFLRYFGDADVDSMTKQVESKFLSGTPTSVAFLSATLGIAITILALFVDKGYVEFQPSTHLPPDSFRPFQLTVEWPANLFPDWLFFGCGYFLLYFLAARTTYVARFYTVFTNQISTSNSLLNKNDPRNTPALRDVMVISRNILSFWMGISLSIATLPLLFRDMPTFTYVVVLTTMFFSLGVGALVFVLSEDQLRRAVHRTSNQRIFEIRAEMDSLIAADKPTEEQERRYNILKEHYAQLVASGHLGGYLISLISLALPLVGIVVQIVVDLT